MNKEVSVPKVPSATRYWRLLRNYIKCGDINSVNNPLLSADVFGLFHVTLCDEKPLDSLTSVTWWKLALRNFPSPNSFLVPIPNDVTSKTSSSHLDILVGFDRSGVVSLWPCELLLARIFLSPLPALQHLQFLQSSQRALEIAAGGFGLAAVAFLARCRSSPASAKLQYLAVTDGNTQCVDRLDMVFNALQADCSPTVDVAMLRWSETDKAPELPDGHDNWRHLFDLIFASDCFFMHNTHEGLLAAIDFLLSLSPGSTFLALAPQRGGTLEKFVRIASAPAVSNRRSGLALTVIPPVIAFPDLSGDPEGELPHLLYLQRR